MTCVCKQFEARGLSLRFGIYLFCSYEYSKGITHQGMSCVCNKSTLKDNSEWLNKTRFSVVRLLSNVFLGLMPKTHACILQST